MALRVAVLIHSLPLRPGIEGVADGIPRSLPPPFAPGAVGVAQQARSIAAISAALVTGALTALVFPGIAL